jgi:hypothetical protein
MDQRTELTPGELVARWEGRRTLGTLKNWRHRGLGPPFRLVDHRVFYALADVEAWERDHPLNHFRASPRLARAANQRRKSTQTASVTGRTKGPRT